MKMKKMFNALLVLALVCAVGVFIVYAAAPTVTTTARHYDRFSSYSFSYTTSIGTLDTSFIYFSNGPFSMGGMGVAGADSMATLELWTSEATADSVRHAVYVQGTSKYSPNTTERSMTGSSQEWHTILVDSASFNNLGTSAIPKFIKIPWTRLAGRLPYSRIVITEIGSTAKDATQTVRGRYGIPKYMR